MSETTKLGGLERRGPTAVARPAYIKEGRRGTENITSQDIRPPALRIAQSMSPETKRSELAYIQGLREGDLFNSITRENYGEGPIGLVVVNQLGHRHVEFAPLSEGGGVLDFNVPDGDPRTEFTTGPDGKRVKPRATKFYDYLVLALQADGRRELMTLSLKSTQLKVATKLNTLLALAKVDSFALQFSARSLPDKRGIYAFYSWSIEPAGFVAEDVFFEAEAHYEKLRGKTVVVEHETNTDDPDDKDVPF